MRLRFDPMADDEDEFVAVQSLLVDEVRDWAAERFEDTEGVRAMWAGTFLQWKYGYGDGRLDAVTRTDLAEFLLDWCPAKVSAGPETASEIIDGVSAYVEFMAATGRLVGSFDRAAELIVMMGDLVGEMEEALGDRSKFGMAKSLFAPTADEESGSPFADLIEAMQGENLSREELQQLLDDRMAAFNELPFEERKRLTDPALTPRRPERVQLSWVHIAPSADEVERSAQASRLVAMVDRLVEWLGPKGRPVTQTGAFRLADARHLVDLLGTGDTVDRAVFGEVHKLRSSRQLPVLSWVADIADQADAVTVGTSKMTAAPGWQDLAVTERAQRLVDAVFDVGVLSVRDVGGIHAWVGELLDDGVPHWLVGVLPAGEERDIDEVVGYALEVCNLEFPGIQGRWGSELWSGMIERHVHTLFGALELTGLVELRGRSEQVDKYGFTETTGGSFTGTALLRWLLPEHARAAGYDFAELGDLETADAVAVVKAFATGDLELEAIKARWLAGTDTATRGAARAAALTDAAAYSTEPHVRVAAFGLLVDLVEPGDAAPAVRQMLDSPAAGHAALYLVSHGLASSAEMAGFFSVGPLVDHLSLLIDEPETLGELFSHAQERADGDLLDDLWRHDQPETLAVLESLGASTTDKRLAKNARKAALRHRTWLADRRHRAGNTK